MAAQTKDPSDSNGVESGGEPPPTSTAVPSTPPAPVDPNTEMKERLVGAVKKEVKQLMEQAVTKKLIHEDSGSVTSLCAAVEASLGQGLRRRALGLFKTSSTTALLHKIAKNCPEAEIISRRVLEAEGETSFPTATRSASGVVETTSRSPSGGERGSQPPPLHKRGSAGGLLSGSNNNSQLPKYLWIRLALFERVLARIIDHLVDNALKYYERDALVADPDYGTILSSLLVGPCALEYTKAKTLDHFWSDPPADELVQRHRISGGTTTPPSCRRPILNFRRSLNASSDDNNVSSTNSLGGVTCAKDYVESLHQNARAALLYGKNNVRVQPKDTSQPIPGYLSLHQTPNGLVIKWTPNQLMNGYTESETVDKGTFPRSVMTRRGSNPITSDWKCRNRIPLYRIDRRFSESSLCCDCVYWAMSLQLCVSEVVYVHVHEGSEGAALILVGQDGVQRPPIHFPKGGHLLAFLSCLETGLLPHGQLDPPLWSQKGSGKVFPRVIKPRKRPMPRLLERDSSSDKKEEEPMEDDEEFVTNDYVFRIVTSAHSDHQEIVRKHSLLERIVSAVDPVSPRRKALASSSTNSSDSSTMSVDAPPPTPASTNSEESKEQRTIPVTQSASIALVCSSMRRQIISRAFYGWLAYCRHLSTVRTHLSGLVHANIVPKENTEGGLTKERWEAMQDDNGAVTAEDEVYRLVYYGGCQHELRKDVWPYLLEYYQFGSTKSERAEKDVQTKRTYETTMSEWLCVEAIVRQKDREATAASIARLNPNQHQDEVFEDNCSMISDDIPIVSPEESQSEKKTDTIRPILSREPTIDEVENIECDRNEIERMNIDSNTNRIETITEDQEEHENQEVLTNGHGKGSIIEEIDEDESDTQLNVSERNNPDARRESIAEIKRLAENIVQKSDGRGPLTSVESMNESTPQHHHSVIVTNPSVDLIAGTSPHGSQTSNPSPSKSPLGVVIEEPNSIVASFDTLDCHVVGAQEGDSRSNCVSPASSNGGVYSNELVECFALNLHRIEKDVQRCDRNYYFFTTENLDKLRNIMCTYVWEHLEPGYMQGMCDLAAPLLVILQDEATAHACFTLLMSKAKHNFPSGRSMDDHFANMRSLIQILDAEMYELMDTQNDYSHFYFCYRWFLLDFKRELLYQDVFAAWELTWSARRVASEHMVLFLALALLETYRDIILSNNMDFTDIIKFFNEMAERHDALAIMNLARDLVLQVQTLIENK